jgi:hypothetical protein
LVGRVITVAALLLAGCRKPATSVQAPNDSLTFESLVIPVPRGVEAAVDKAKKQVLLWSKALPKGFVRITRVTWPAGEREPLRACQQLFSLYKPAFEKARPSAKFLGPAAVFETKTLRFVGGSWRSPDRTMASLTFTAVADRAYMVEAVLPSADSVAKKREARKTLQSVVGSIERLERG